MLTCKWISMCSGVYLIHISSPFSSDSRALWYCVYNVSFYSQFTDSEISRSLRRKGHDGQTCKYLLISRPGKRVSEACALLDKTFFFCRTKAAYVRQTLHVWLIFTSLNFCSVTHRFSAEHFETLIESCTIYFRSYCTFVPLLFLKICVPFFFFSE